MSSRRAIYGFIFFLTVVIVHPNAAESAPYSLKDLFRLAIEQSEILKIEEEQIAIAETLKNKKKSLLLPRFTGYGGITEFTESKHAPETVVGTFTLPGTVIQPRHLASFGARFDYTLTMNGRELIDYTIARENIEKQKREFESQKEQYLMTVASAYFEVLRAKKMTEIAEANVNRLKAHRDAAEKRLKVGEVTKTVLLRAEGELSGAHSELIKAQNTWKIARVNLGRLVGMEGEYELREDPDGEVDIPSLDYLWELAIKERLDLKIRELDYRMAREYVRVAKGGNWPVISLSGVYSRTDQDPGAPTLNRESIYSQLTLQFPFFEGGLRQAEIREAKIREKQAELRIRDVIKAVKVEVEAAYLELMTQRSIIKSLEDQQKYASDNFNVISRQFEYGLASSVEVMDANTLLLSAQRKLAIAIFEERLCLMKLKRVTGILLKYLNSENSTRPFEIRNNR